MNEQLQKAVAEALDLFKQAATTASNYAAQEIPVVIQELLRWKFAEACIWTALSFIVLVGVGFLVRLFIKKLNDPRAGEEWFFLLFPIIGGGLPGAIRFIDNLTTAVQIYIAPRVYLLEWLKEQVN